MDLQGKRVLVYGAGRSGMGAVSLLLSRSALPVLFDENESLDEADVRERLLNEAQADEEASETDLKRGADALVICAGKVSDELLDKLDIAVLSPGVPCDKPLVQELYRRGIPVWSEIELAWNETRGETLAITGTNGKTTTTALLGKIMADARPSVFVVGNIGTAWTGQAPKTRPDSVTVAEVSSFQLETIHRFHPKISAILNITEDHLNRHHTMEEYARVKERIAMNQDSGDVCVLNAEDPYLRQFGKELEGGPKAAWFSSASILEEGAFLKDGWIIIRDGQKEYPLVRTQELKILGTHNYENAMAAALMAYYDGVPLESIQKSMLEFTAVPHRIEYVAEKRGVVYYNDSKGTNPDAAIKGIEAMNRPTYLIGGGYDKGSSYDEWIQAFGGKVRKLILIGQTKEKIRDAALKNGFEDVLLCEDLEEAVAKCALLAQPGDAVLLSPACASWGQFDNYEQRGDRFKEMVRALEE